MSFWSMQDAGAGESFKTVKQKAIYYMPFLKKIKYFKKNS